MEMKSLKTKLATGEKENAVLQEELDKEKDFLMHPQALWYTQLRVWHAPKSQGETHLRVS